jgi:hypothetical protein
VHGVNRSVKGIPPARPTGSLYDTAVCVYYTHSEQNTLMRPATVVSLPVMTATIIRGVAHLSTQDFAFFRFQELLS